MKGSNIKILFIIIAAFKTIIGGIGYAQTTLFIDDFGSSAQNPISRTGWTADAASGSNWELRTTGASASYSWSSPTVNASGGANVFTNLSTNTNTKTLTYNNSLSTVGYNTIRVRFGGIRSGTVPDLTISYSTDGVTYTSAGTVALTTSWTAYTVTLPATAEGVSNLRIRIAVVANNNASNFFRIDDFHVIGTASSGGSITIGTHSGAPYSLSNCSSTASGTLAYTISGTFNAGNVFTAELSDASGAFTQPLAIGSLTSTSSGSISLTIPAGIPSGSGYQLRITSTDPVATSGVSSAFTITQNGEYCPWIGDYRSNATGNWTSTSTWNTFNYNAGTKTVSWGTATAEPNNSVRKVIIQNTHTVTLNDGPKSVSSLIVNTGGKLYRNASGVSQLCYINLHGDIVCNGTIGNGSTNDAIGFNIQSGSHTIKGSGNFDCYRIRNSDESGGGNSTLTIDMDINLRWSQTIGGAGSGTNALYNNRGATCTFDVTINSGKTVNITNSTGDGGFGLDGAGTGTYPSTNRGGTFTVFGNLYANGPVWLGSNNTSNKPQLVIENGGVVRVRYVDFGSDNANQKASVTVKSGGKFEITGNNGSGSSWVNTSTVTLSDLSFQTNSTVEYSGSVSQSIYHGPTYKKLVINGSGVKTLTGNTTIDEELTLTSGIITTGSNRIHLNNSSASSLVGGSSSSFINGNLRRNIATNTSTYDFPIGDGTSSTNFKRISFVNNNISGVTYLDAFVNSITETGDNVESRINTSICYEDGDGGSINTPLDQIQESAIWDLTPNASPSGGSYGVRLYVANVSGLSSADDNRFAVVKRPSASTDYADWNSFASTTTIPAVGAAGRIYSSGTGYAQKSGFTSFSKFAIAKTSYLSGPLPIELMSFKADKIQGKSKLTWITASELNNDYFLIEKSKDSKTFVNIGKIQGKGNSNELSFYEFVDETPFCGNNYYRLKQVDFDGKYTYSELKNLYFNSHDLTGFKAYYHNQSVTVDFPQPLSETEIKIGNLEGKILYQAKYEGERSSLDVPLEDWSKGLYFITVVNSQTTLTTKFVIQ